MSDERERLEHAIAALQAQRAALGADLLALALAPLQDRLASLQGEAGVRQLRLVTVLFADVVGSTALSQHLDPEEIGTLMDGTLARFSAIVQAHQGRVLQYAGDSLLAAFGTAQAHEDDAERALLAGLAILAAGREVAAQVLARHGHDGFGLRIGADTGQVLLGGGVDGEDSIRGITVNLAARMEQTAPPGTMRISQHTFRQVRGKFDLLAQPPLPVKGHDEPIQSYLVQGRRAAGSGQSERGVDGVAVHMVGRQAQLEQLQQAYARQSATPRPGLQGVAVQGDAGIGKTRLLAEFRHWVQAQPGAARWLHARGAEPSMGRPYAMLRALLCEAVGLPGADADSAQVAAAQWLAAAAPLLVDPADAAVLGHLLGFDFSAHPALRALHGQARQLRDQAYFHASQLLRALASGPDCLVAVLDDLHWADDATLDFLAYLVQSQADLPLLLLSLARRSLWERRPEWNPSAPPAMSRIALEPLAGAPAQALADALLARLGQVPQALRELVAGRAEGNPFYMEELVNMLLDQGVILAEAGVWQLQPARLRALSLPSSLVGVLQARLDALPEPERRTAQLAAVVGFRFWDDSLVALRAPMPQALQGLLAGELARAQQPSSLPGMGEYAFRHQMLHQVAYDGVLKPVKRATHAQVARWLLGLPGATPPEWIAEHAERGGETALALDMWQRAAEAAAGHFANAQVLAHADRALALAGADDWPRRHALCLLRCKALNQMSAPERLGPELDILDSIAARLGDATWVGEAQCLRARHHYNRSDIGQAMALAERVLAGTPQTALRCHTEAQVLLGQCLLRLGQHGRARAELQHAMALAEAADDKTLQGVILNDLAMLALDQGDPGAALPLYEQALQQHRELGHLLNQGGTLSNLGYVALVLGDYATARQQFSVARALCARIGHRQNEAITLVNLAIAQVHQGQAEAALANAGLAVTMLQAASERWAQAAAWRVMGQAALGLGDADAGFTHFSTSCEMFEGLKMPHLAIEAMAGLAEVAAARQDGPAALAQVDAILQRLAGGVSLDGTEEPMRVHLVCHRVLAAAADPRAAPLLQHAHQELTARAGRISDPARRRSFLEAVPHHRQIAEAWALQHHQPGRHS